LVRHGNGGQAKSFSDVGVLDGNTVYIVKVRGDMSDFCGFVLMKVEDVADGGFDGAC
jgi:hypothetical protein